MHLRALSPSLVASITLCALVTSVSACKAPRIDDYDPGNQPVTVTGGPAEEEILLAEVNGEPISLGAFQRRLDAMTELGRSRLTGSLARQKLLEAMIDMHLLARAAEREGYASDPEVTWAERVALRETVLLRITDEETPEPDLGEAELETFYALEAYRYDRPLSLWLAVVVVPDRTRAEWLARRYRDGPGRDVRSSLEAFDQLVATELSSSGQPGDLGFVTREELDAFGNPALTEAVLALGTAGELADPVPVASGYALVQLRERREPLHQPLSEAEPAIREQVQHERRRFTRERLLREWRAAADIERNDELLARLASARREMAPTTARPAWESWPSLVLDERLTPRRDLGMLGPLLGPPVASPPVDETPPEPMPSDAGGTGE